MSVISFSSSRSAASRSVRWRSSSSTCSSASAYSSWASGLTGPSCSRRRARRSSRALSASRSSSASGSVGRRGLELEPRGQLRELGSRASATWSRTRWPRAPRRPVSASFSRVQAGVQGGLLLGAGSQLRRHVLAGLAVGGQRWLEARRGARRSPRRPSASAAVTRGDRGTQLLIVGDRNGADASIRPRRAPAARARRAGQLERSAASSAVSWARRPAPGPSSGAERRRWMLAAIRRSSSAASSRARIAARCSAMASSRGAVDFGGRGYRTLESARGRLLGLDRLLAGLRRAHRGGCARRAPAPRPPRAPGAPRVPSADHTRPVRVTATPSKEQGERVEARVDDPGVGEQRAGQRQRALGRREPGRASRSALGTGGRGPRPRRTHRRAGPRARGHRRRRRGRAAPRQPARPGPPRLAAGRRGPRRARARSRSRPRARRRAWWRRRGPRPAAQELVDRGELAADPGRLAPGGLDVALGLRGRPARACSTRASLSARSRRVVLGHANPLGMLLGRRGRWGSSSASCRASSASRSRSSASELALQSRDPGGGLARRARRRPPRTAGARVVRAARSSRVAIPPVAFRIASAR